MSLHLSHRNLCLWCFWGARESLDSIPFVVLRVSALRRRCAQDLYGKMTLGSEEQTKLNLKIKLFQIAFYVSILW
jgi:hypothetical protein